MRAKLNPNEYSATVFISSSCGTKSCNNDWLAVGFMLRMKDAERHGGAGYLVGQPIEGDLSNKLADRSDKIAAAKKSVVFMA